MKPDVRAFFDPATWTLTYVVKDPNSASCAIIDSDLDPDLCGERSQLSILRHHRFSARL